MSSLVSCWPAQLRYWPTSALGATSPPDLPIARAAPRLHADCSQRASLPTASLVSPATCWPHSPPSACWLAHFGLPCMSPSPARRFMSRRYSRAPWAIAALALARGVAGCAGLCNSGTSRSFLTCDSPCRTWQRAFPVSDCCPGSSASGPTCAALAQRRQIGDPLRPLSTLANGRALPFFVLAPLR